MATAEPTSAAQEFRTREQTATSLTQQIERAIGKAGQVARGNGVEWADVGTMDATMAALLDALNTLA